MAEATQQELNILQQKAREWASKVVELYNLQVPAEFEGAKRALLASAKTIKNAVEKITGPLDAFAPMRQIPELGVIWFAVGGVAVAAAAAAIYKWTTDYNKFLQQVKMRQQLIDSGVNPKDAQTLVFAPSFSENVKKFGKYGLGAFALYLGAKYFRII